VSGEVKRLNVKATVKNSGLYLAEHLCSIKDLESGRSFDIDHVGGGLVIRGEGRDIVIDYRDIIMEIMKVA
jgi:hypothetical protein